MKFRHTFNVFVDNFHVTYKQLLYRLVILAVSIAICTAVVYPFIKTEIIGSDEFNSLIQSVWGYIENLLNGHVSELSKFSEMVKSTFTQFVNHLQAKTAQFVLSGLLLLVVYVVARWFDGLGNYAAAVIINDRMALRANRHFMATLIGTLKTSAAYNAIYVPISILYDLIVAVGMFFLLFFLLNSIVYFFICVFLFVVVIILSISLKMTFTTDWLPALIRGKNSQLGAIKYSFSRKRKSTLSIFSNFTVLTLLIFAANTAAVILTLGAGLLLTIPASYVLLICFEFVNYYDREEIKYFIDQNTIIRQAKEHTPSREEFFRGE